MTKTQIYQKVADMIREQGYTIAYVPWDPDRPGLRGATDFIEHTVQLGQWEHGTVALESITHELSHIILRHGTPETRDRLGDVSHQWSDGRSQGEVEAGMSAGYALASLGVDDRKGTLSYVSEWANSPEIVRKAEPYAKLAASIIVRGVQS